MSQRSAWAQRVLNAIEGGVAEDQRFPRFQVEEAIELAVAIFQRTIRPLPTAPEAGQEMHEELVRARALLLEVGRVLEQLNVNVFQKAVSPKDNSWVKAYQAWVAEVCGTLRYAAPFRPITAQEFGWLQRGCELIRSYDGQAFSVEASLYSKMDAALKGADRAQLLGAWFAQGGKAEAPPETPTPDEAIRAALTALQRTAYANTVALGVWDRRRALLHTATVPAESIRTCVILEALALVHEEVSEAVSAARHGNPPDDKIPEFTGVEAELADVIIRVLDLAEGFQWRVGEAVLAKLKMNAGRQHMHGKLA